MINCNPCKHILLTGAGFSYGFGGFLASEFRSKLFMRTQVQERPKVRQLLMDEPAFETALARIRSGPNFDDKDREALESAVTEVFSVMDTNIADNEIWRDQPANIYGFQDFLSKFQSRTRGGSETAGFIFTLNQDLMPERKWYNFDHSSYPPVLPGIPISMVMHQQGRHWFSTVVGKLDDSMTITLVGDEPIEFSRQTNYVKMHGSLNWRVRGGRHALVVGSGKSQQIEELPVLATYARAFEEVLMTPERRLMVAGYSFGDEHINSVISRAARDAGLRIAIWDPFGWRLVGDMRDRKDCEGIDQSIIGIWEERLHEVYPANQAKTFTVQEMNDKFFSM